MDKMKHSRLQELDRSDFEIVKGEPDIRGWDVRYLTGQKLGAVEELILDAQEKKVRYMIVDLDDNELKLVHRKILIPIGMAELDRKEDDVLIPNISLEQLSRLPEYDRNNLTAGVERRISSTLGREIESTAVMTETRELKSERSKKEIKKQADIHNDDEIDPDFYSHEHYNADNLYKNRLHQAESQKLNESEYERGLKLWERRSEGGIIDEESRMSAVRDRRNKYQEKRYKDQTA